MIRIQATIAIAAACAVSGCQTATTSATLPSGASAYEVMPPARVAESPTVRTMRSGDLIAVNVFREEELSADKLVIDEMGLVQLPLIGEMQAAGLRPAELSRAISARLGARYLRNPQVSVTVVEAVPVTVTVEGQVNSPGVFPLRQNETLLSTLARAKSPTQTAKLDEVVVFRTVDQQKMAAVFDLKQIRTGQAPDPQIIDGDIVVVGFSSVKGAFRDFLQAAPLLNVFSYF